MVQQQAARWVKQDYRLTSSVSEMINDLQWSTLHECRKFSRLIIFYNFLHQDPPDISIPEHYSHHSLSRYTWLSHHKQLMPPLMSFNYYQKSFFPYTIIDWNHLPNEIIECSTLDEFLYHPNFVWSCMTSGWTKHLDNHTTLIYNGLCLLFGVVQLHPLCCISLMAVLHSNKIQIQMIIINNLVLFKRK